ncbi:MAG: hypothetical protein M1833_001283, partial [Piccolia ochrophora]
MSDSSASLRLVRKHIFSSVFPTSTAASTQPTPVATPETSFVLPGQSFGGPTSDRTLVERHVSSDNVADHIRWGRAWHTATSFLALSKEPVPDVRTSQGNVDGGKWLKNTTPGVDEAIALLLSPDIPSGARAGGFTEGSLVEWYVDEMRRHFQAFVRPELLLILSNDNGEESLELLLDKLHNAQRIYLHPLTTRIAPAISAMYDPMADDGEWSQSNANAALLLSKCRRDLHAVVASSLPQEQLSSLLNKSLTCSIQLVLGLPTADEGSQVTIVGQLDEDLTMSDALEPETSWKKENESFESWTKFQEQRQDRIWPQNETEPAEMRGDVRHRIHRTFRALEEVGLGRERAQRVFAEIMNRVMTEHVHASYSDQWETPSQILSRLNDWIENRFSRLAVEVLHCLEAPLGVESETGKGEWQRWKGLVSFDDVAKWKDMGIGRLGRMRVKQLFDILVDWDNSKGAIEDLKSYVTTPATRGHLVSAFTKELSRRLLHPGASTKEILHFYISMIRAFNLLDPKGVLLERVARPVRRYLSDRDDTVRVIVTGLLSDPENAVTGHAHDSGEILFELSVELGGATEVADRGDDDADLDWDDMQWTPDPVDAGPDYKKSRSSDVIGSLMSLFASKDVFVKEFQNIMGERLLKKEFDAEKEARPSPYFLLPFRWANPSQKRVLELLKLRFGESALQACEVMLRDVSDSKAIDRNIRTDQHLHLSAAQLSSPSRRQSAGSHPAPALHAKILSRLFWPDLHDATFNLPPAITSLQSRYEHGFETLKQSRKLTWLPALGHATVELALADRVIAHTVPTWHAAVIHAFADPHASPKSRPVARSVPELVSVLAMDESLVRNALAYWSSRRVLVETRPDTYTVLERLDRAPPTSPSSSASTRPARPTLPPTTSSTVAATGPSSVSALKSSNEQDRKTKKFHDVYWHFIVGMLTNAGAMPLPQMATMLDMVVPGGMAAVGGQEGLREFLTEM